MQLKKYDGDLEALNVRRRDPRRKQLQEWVKYAADTGEPQEIIQLDTEDVDIIATRVRGYAKSLGYTPENDYTVSVFRIFEVPSVVIVINKNGVVTTPATATTNEKPKRRPRKRAEAA